MRKLLLGHFEHLIHQAVLDRLLCIQVEIAIGIGFNDLDRFTGVLGHDIVQQRAQAQDLFGLDFDVRGLSLGATKGLV